MQLGRAFLMASLPLLVGAGNVLADDIFTVVSSESTLTLTVLDTTTVVSSAQTTGAAVTTGSSATAQIGGQLGVTLGGGDITINAADTTLPLLLQTGTGGTLNLKPSLTGGAGSAPADVGLNLSFKVTDIITLTASGQGAGRGIVSDASSTAIPLTGTSFNASGVSLGISAGTLAYSLSATITSVSGSASFTTSPIANQSTGHGSLTTTVTSSGMLETLTIPISILIPDLISTLGADLGTSLKGTIVATFFNAIPEPGSFTLMGIAALGGLGWAGWVRRRRASGK
jgi:hypothetical protein